MNRVLKQGGIRFGHSSHPHRGIKALSRDDANADYARQQRECCDLEDQCDPISGSVPFRGHPMPYELDPEEERECKDPIPDQHIKKRPLTRAEAEIFDARVAAGPHVACFIMALFDGMLLRFARRLDGHEASDDRPQGVRSRSFV